MQELTNYIQNMLQQMQDRFQSMSDQVIEVEPNFLLQKDSNLINPPNGHKEIVKGSLYYSP